MSMDPDQAERLALEAIDALRSFDPDKKKPDRGPPDTIWRAIDAGVLSDENTVKWARIVAADVVKNVIDNKADSQDRPKRALLALKLHGPGGQHYIEKRALELILGWERFRALLNGHTYTVPTPAEAANTLKKAGHFEALTPREVTNIISKWPIMMRQE